MPIRKHIVWPSELLTYKGNAIQHILRKVNYIICNTFLDNQQLKSGPMFMCFRDNFHHDEGAVNSISF